MSHESTFKSKSCKEYDDKMRAKYQQQTYHCDLCSITVNYYAKSNHNKSRRHLKAMDRAETVIKSDPKPSKAFELGKAKLDQVTSRLS